MGAAAMFPASAGFSAMTTCMFRCLQVAFGYGTEVIVSGPRFVRSHQGSIEPPGAVLGRATGTATVSELTQDHRALCRQGVRRRGAAEGIVGRGHQMLQFPALVGDAERIPLHGRRKAALRAERQPVPFDTAGRSFDPS